jgi:acetyltransferase-like isoleucine patch superfamily enzyme
MLVLGDRTGIGAGNIFGCQGGITIGSRVMIGTDVIIYTTNHVWSVEAGTYADQGLTCMPVSIGDDAWIGSRAIILAGVSIGRGVTVGAGAVVTRSVPDYAVAIGVPARVIKFKQHRD